ncbi:nicotinamide riboside transporter PnuC [Spiroplasma endosymbiont of Crioceris asparagi]|uniref:nicotinamide riboside transporter PnuC n=1 Tax=Spiroplasma endosymbiont of Crioceris asparagi TaxID=3066286 RepID=UPI0030CBDB45
MKKLRKINFLGFYNVISEFKALNKYTKIAIYVSSLIFLFLGIFDIQLWMNDSNHLLDENKNNIFKFYQAYHNKNTYINVPVINVIFQSMNIFTSITGIIAVIMVAEKAISSFFWSVLNVITFVIYAFNIKMLGDFQIMLFFILPVLIIGWFNWAKSQNLEFEDKKRINTPWKKIILGLIILAITALFTYLFKIELYWLHKHVAHDNYVDSTNHQVIWYDSFTSSCYIAGIALQALKSQAQYISWLLVNIFSVVKYMIPSDGGGSQYVLALQSFIYLCTTFLGIYNWYIKDKIDFSALKAKFSKK